MFWNDHPYIWLNSSSLCSMIFQSQKSHMLCFSYPYSRLFFVRFCSDHLCSKAPVGWVLTQISWVFSSKLLSFEKNSLTFEKNPWVLRKNPWVLKQKPWSSEIWLSKVESLRENRLKMSKTLSFEGKLSEKAPAPYIFRGNGLKKLRYLEFWRKIVWKSCGIIEETI